MIKLIVLSVNASVNHSHDLRPGDPDLKFKLDSESDSESCGLGPGGPG